MTTGRNDLCPCGSGSKYKHCCQEKDKHPYFSRTGLILGLAVAVVLAGGVAALFNDTTSDAETERKLRDVLQGTSESAPATAPPVAAGSTTPAPQPTPGTPVPQPSGAAPAGKVWSSEHGHWHDAPSVQVEASNPGGVRATVDSGHPQPGMVWNEEHGHYHRVNPNATPEEAAAAQAGNVPTTAIPRDQIPRISVGMDGQARTSVPIPPPPGPAPEGKVWSSEHGHWHDQPAFPSGDFPESESSADRSGQDPQ